MGILSEMVGYFSFHTNRKRNVLGVVALQPLVLREKEEEWERVRFSGFRAICSGNGPIF